jgi:hypothetical protein
VATEAYDLCQALLQHLVLDEELLASWQFDKLH